MDLIISMEGIDLQACKLLIIVISNLQTITFNRLSVLFYR